MKLSVGSSSGRGVRGLEMLLGLMGVQYECLKSRERTQGTLKLRRLALVFEVVAPHFIKLAAFCARITQHLLSYIGFTVI